MTILRLILSVVLTFGPAASAFAAAGDNDTDWHLPKPAAVKPSDVELQTFSQAQNSGSFDSLCRSFPLALSNNFAGAFVNWLSLGFGYERSLQRYMNGGLALVDGIKLQTGVSDAVGRVLLNATDALPLTVGSSISGQSFVVRPIVDPKDPAKQVSDCDAFRTELQFYKGFYKEKIVYPVTSERLSKMMVGEIWKIPVAFSLSIGAGANAGDVPIVPVTVNFSLSGNSQTNLTVFRKAKNVTRVRLRLDSATVLSAGGGVIGTWPIFEFAVPSEFFLKMVDQYVQRFVNNYFLARLDVNWSRMDGHQIVIEYELNPENEEQMAALSKLLRGHLDVMDKLKDLRIHAWNVVRGLNSDQEERRIADEKEKSYDATIGKPADFAGVDAYKRLAETLPHLHLPILLDQEWDNNTTKDRMILIDDDDGEFRVFSHENMKQLGWLDIPFFGRYFNVRESEAVAVFEHEGNKGEDAPMLKYVQQAGAMHRDRKTAEGFVKNIDSIVSLTGTYGNGPNPKTALPPVEKLFNDPPRDPNDASPRENPTYRSSQAALTLIFMTDALRQAMNASVTDIAKATLVVLGRPDIDTLAEKFAGAITTRYGELYYDDNLLTKKEQNSKEAKEVLAVARDLKTVNNLSRPSYKAEFLEEMSRGQARSSFSNEDFIKILIQLVAPNSVWASFFLHADGDPNSMSSQLLHMLHIGGDLKPKININNNLEMHDDHPDMDKANNLTGAQQRFAPPPNLYD